MNAAKVHESYMFPSISSVREVTCGALEWDLSGSQVGVDAFPPMYTVKLSFLVSRFTVDV